MEEDMTIMRKSPRRWDIPVPWAFYFYRLYQIIYLTYF